MSTREIYTSNAKRNDGDHGAATQGEGMQCKLPVAVIGAGPVGLAAAAHLAARGERFVVLETGASVGHSMLQWGHVRVFSPWRYNVDRTARRLLESTGWRHPTPDALPTGR